MSRLFAWLVAATLLSCADAFSDITIKYQNNKLYYRINSNTQERAYQTLYGFVRLARPGQPPVPNVTLTLAGASSDYDMGGATVAYWRWPGNETPYLWPDFDFYGWPDTFVPPWPLYLRHIAKRFPLVWHQRHPRVFWSGAAMMHRIRYFFVRCAEAHPRLFQYRNIEWLQLRDPLAFLLLNDTLARPKRLEADNREFADFQWAIYFPGRTWSTSLKWIAASGAALMVPETLEHESFFSQALLRRRELLATHAGVEVKENPGERDFEALCAAMNHTMQSRGEDAEEMAHGLRNLVHNELGIKEVEKYMLDTLWKIAKKQETQTPEELEKEFPPVALQELTCAELKRMHLNHTGMKTGWQIEEWYDDDCEFREADYLHYMAI